MSRGHGTHGGQHVEIFFDFCKERKEKIEKRKEKREKREREKRKEKHRKNLNENT